MSCFHTVRQVCMQAAVLHIWYLNLCRVDLYSHMFRRSHRSTQVPLRVKVSPSPIWVCAYIVHNFTGFRMSPLDDNIMSDPHQVVCNVTSKFAYCHSNSSDMTVVSPRLIVHWGPSVDTYHCSGAPYWALTTPVLTPSSVASVFTMISSWTVAMLHKLFVRLYGNFWKSSVTDGQDT